MLSSVRETERLVTPKHNVSPPLRHSQARATSPRGRGFGITILGRGADCSEPPKLDFARFGEPHALLPFVFAGGETPPLRINLPSYCRGGVSPPVCSCGQSRTPVPTGLRWIIIMLVGEWLGAAVCFLREDNIFPYEYGVAVHSAFCILHSALSILHSAFCIF